MWFSCASSEKKKLRWVNFPPLRKKTTIAPRKNDEKCPTLPRTTKKSLKKILQKKLKNNREKKNMKKTTKHTQKTYDEWKKIIERSDNFLSQKNEKK